METGILTIVFDLIVAFIIAIGVAILASGDSE